MAFKQGENIADRGKLFPVFIADDGNMYTVNCTEDQLDLLQIMIPMTLDGDVKIDPTPLNEDNYTMRIEIKNKLKKLS